MYSSTWSEFIVLGSRVLSDLNGGVLGCDVSYHLVGGPLGHDQLLQVLARVHHVLNTFLAGIAPLQIQPL